MSSFYFDPSKFLDLVTLSNPAVTKSVNFDLETAQNGAGAFVASITGVTGCHPGLPNVPDYWVDVVFSGMTFPEYDQDKQIFFTMHAEALNAVQNFTPELLTSALGFSAPARVLGVINVESTFAYDGATNIFRISFRLCTTEAFLSYYEQPLPEYQVYDAGNGVTYVRFVNSDPCAVQRITRTVTTAPDGGLRVLIVREVAFGSWGDMENLTYYPINQPVPVTIES